MTINFSIFHTWSYLKLTSENQNDVTNEDTTSIQTSTHDATKAAGSKYSSITFCAMEWKYKGGILSKIIKGVVSGIFQLAAAYMIMKWFDVV